MKLKPTKQYRFKVLDISTATPNEILRHCSRVFPKVECYGISYGIRFINKSGGVSIIEHKALPHHFPHAFKNGA